MIHNTQKLLFIGHLWPEPNSSAAGYRTLALLNALVNDKNDQGQSSWQIHFACAADKTEFCADLDSLGIHSQGISLNDSSFDHYVKDLNPEIVFYDRFITEEQFSPRVHEHCPNAIHILDTQDLHFLRRARQQALKKNTPVDFFSAESQDDCIREIAAILRCDLSLIISRYEMQLLTTQFAIHPSLIHYCPFMLSTEQLETSMLNQTLKTYNEREHFVMIGNFLHPPNWDAVLWCYQAIWPLIREQLPQTQIHIYGAYPSEKVYQLHQPDKGFIIKGRANNAIHTLAQYRVNLAPLRFGAGIKGKIADGFIAKTPCVTTHIGFEGMGDNKETWAGLVVDNSNQNEQAQHLAQAAIRLYQNRLLWQQQSQATHTIIKTLFSETEHSHALLNVLHHLKNHINTHRQKNFMGKILRHNLYRSQYFMSKWIEEKNKEK